MLFWIRSSRSRLGMIGQTWCFLEWDRADRDQVWSAELSALPNEVEPAEVRYGRPGLMLPQMGSSRPRLGMAGWAWCSPEWGRVCAFSNEIEPAEVRYGRLGLVLLQMGSSRPRSDMAGRAWCSPNKVEPAEVRYGRSGLMLPRMRSSRPRSDMIDRTWCFSNEIESIKIMTDRA